MKQHYMHIHLYVQQLYRNSRPHEKLETFYAASLQEEAQRMYSTYFVAYLKMLIGRLSEMDDLINLKKLSSVSPCDDRRDDHGLSTVQTFVLHPR